jgi:hypothetical protein
MTKLRLVHGLAVLLALTAIATSALAAAPKSGTCSRLRYSEAAPFAWTLPSTSAVSCVGPGA